MRLLLIIVLVAVIAIAFILVARASGPRVTHIEHRREDDDEGEDSQ